jgi:hypothetical protein
MGVQKFRRIRRLQFPGAEPALHRLARRCAQGIERTFDKRRFFAFRKTAGMGRVHVPAVAQHFAAVVRQRGQQRGVANGQLRIDGKAGLHAQLLEGFQKAVDAHAVAIVAQRVVAQVRVRHGHGAWQLHRLTRRVQREVLEAHVHPHRQRLAMGPLNARAVGEHRPFVAVVVHAVGAARVFQMVGFQRHGQASCPRLPAVPTAATEPVKPRGTPCAERTC